MNKAFFIGNLTKDPEVRSFTSGDRVCNFTVAVNRRTKDGAQMADFVRVSVFRAMADVCGQYLTKGKKVAVIGKVSASAYKDQNGEARAQLELIADDVEFLTPKGEAEQPAQAPQQIDRRTGYAVADDDELPF